MYNGLRSNDLICLQRNSNTVLSHRSLMTLQWINASYYFSILFYFHRHFIRYAAYANVKRGFLYLLQSNYVYKHMVIFVFAASHSQISNADMDVSKWTKWKSSALTIILLIIFFDCCFSNDACSKFIVQARKGVEMSTPHIYKEQMQQIIHKVETNLCQNK